MKFTILIVSYQSGKDLDRLFDCLERQKIRDFEIILIDNASPLFAPNEAQKSRADIFISNSENIGFARANNQGAKVAKGDWLILLNPDAFPDENWLLEIDRGIDNYPNCESFASLQYLDGQDGVLDGAGDCFSIYGIAWRGGHRKPIPQNLHDGEVFSACGAASIWKKSRFLELGGFEESFNSYYEDVDLGFRHRLLSGNCILLANAIVHHKASASSSRYSDYAVFHGIRNRELAYIRLMPNPWFWLMLLPHLAWVFALWLHAFIRGAGISYSKGIWAAIKMSPYAFKQRKAIQAAKTQTNRKIIELMAISPMRLLRRAIIKNSIK